MMVDAPARKIATTHIVWPRPGVPIVVDSVAYVVQPAAAAPMGTKNDAVSTHDDTNMVQNDIMFSVGNTMSRAPMPSGMQKLPNPPIMIGVMAKKIMMVPCMVNNEVYAAGDTTPSELTKISLPM